MQEQDDDVHRMPQSSCFNFLRGKFSRRTGKTDPLDQIAIIPGEKLTIFFDQILGKGHFGVVCRGLLYEEIVAVKFLNNNFNVSDGPSSARDEFVHEVLMLMSLSHKNVISFRGVRLNPPCIVTEYCPHGSLYCFLGRKNDRLARPLQIPNEEQRRKKELRRWKRKLRLVIGIAKGMYYLHQRPNPIIHRDFKSPNVILKEDNTPVITDFGLARHRPARMQDGLNPTWAAPEVVIDNQAACQKSDIFAFAIVMWEILTGKRPWDGSHPFRIHSLLANEERPTVDAELPQDWPGVGQYVELMRNCWAQTREDRPCIKDIVCSLNDIWTMANPAQLNAENDLIPVSRTQAQQVENREIPSSGHQDSSREGMAETGVREIEPIVRDGPSAPCRGPSEISWDLESMNEVVGEGPQSSGGAHSSGECQITIQIQSPFLKGAPSLPPRPSL